MRHPINMDDHACAILRAYDAGCLIVSVETPLRLEKKKSRLEGGSVYREASKGWDEDPSGQFSLLNCHGDSRSVRVNDRLNTGGNARA